MFVSPAHRFKSHMFDLLFMEKVARWLTNTQVKIKGEVAASNSQAQTLAGHLKDLERRIDACEKPNLDKEVGARCFNAAISCLETFQGSVECCFTSTETVGLLGTGMFQGWDGAVFMGISPCSHGSIDACERPTLDREVGGLTPPSPIWRCFRAEVVLFLWAYPRVICAVLDLFEVFHLSSHLNT